MVKMFAPHSRVIFEVADSNVEKRLSMGFMLADGEEAPKPAPEPDKEPEPLVLPDDDATIAEITAFAAEHGVKLAKGKKADMLAALRKALGA